ncbi:DUF1963 domain-containing protein [Qipengyuania sp. JC766]|uniref:DUF1963 domain-containing protein n=1 Tax=Qipengyuania sp. JC766 TaxID=3232139 RepID=UPI00345A44DF
MMQYAGQMGIVVGILVIALLFLLRERQKKEASSVVGSLGVQRSMPIQPMDDDPKAERRKADAAERTAPEGDEPASAREKTSRFRLGRRKGANPDSEETAEARKAEEIAIEEHVASRTARILRRAEGRTDADPTTEEAAEPAEAAVSDTGAEDETAREYDAAEDLIASEDGAAIEFEPTDEIEEYPYEADGVGADTASPAMHDEHDAVENGERVGIVLRRQIPPRDKAPRSWLGGLPMMPDDMEWPRGTNPDNSDAGDVPLHFVAQIECSALPDDLWDGSGPRDGWLLFFLNGNTSQQEEGTYRVIHTTERGAQRMPPSDIGAVHDGHFAGSQFGFMPQAHVPPVWPFWPVDVVAVPAELYEQDGIARATPPHFAQSLYAGDAVGEYTAPDLAPFTWGCLYSPVLKSAESMEAPAPVDPDREAARLHEALSQIGDLRSLAHRLDEDIVLGQERLDNAGDAMDPEMRQRLQERVARDKADRADFAGIIERNSDAHSMTAFLRAEADGYREWRAQSATFLREVAAKVGGIDPDTPLAQEDWHELRQMLEERTHGYWVLRENHGAQPVLERVVADTWSAIDRHIAAATRAYAVQCYVDPALRDSVLPEGHREALEPWLRTLSDNRPHRMGGYHDSVQTSPLERPPGHELLLQLASDDPMHWCWGNAGAVYFTISADALAAGEFDQAQCEVECH